MSFSGPLSTPIKSIPYGLVRYALPLEHSCWLSSSFRFYLHVCGGLRNFGIMLIPLCWRLFGFRRILTCRLSPNHCATGGNVNYLRDLIIVRSVAISGNEVMTILFLFFSLGFSPILLPSYPMSLALLPHAFFVFCLRISLPGLALNKSFLLWRLPATR